MTITNDLHDLSCHLQRSIRYHKARERFFGSWSSFNSFLSLIMGSAVVVGLLSDHLPDYVALGAGTAVAVSQSLELVLQWSTKARDHQAFASEFAALERVLASRDAPDAAFLRDLRAEVLTIEAREPPIKRYLDLICHNQVARALGSNDLARVTWWQRLTAQYRPGDSAGSA